jgi:hypothetical protein
VTKAASGGRASERAVTQVSAPGYRKEYVVKLHEDEGVATYIGPEPCAGVREDVGEASAEEQIGEP